MPSELALDGTVIWATLAEPGRGFARAVARRRALSAVVLCTALSLLATALVLPSLDAEAVAGDALRPDMTPHERTQAIESATKLHEVTTWAAAATGPGASAFLVALGLWLGFWVAGARTGFKTAFTVAAHALVPQALRALLTVPAALVRAPVAPDALSALLPSSLAALVPASLSLPAPALAAASAIDLFTLWTVALAGSGMAKASGASRARTGVVLAVLFVAYVAVFKVVPAAGGLWPKGAP
jgi:Yip1 domain